MLLCVNVSASLGRSLVPRTIIGVKEESYTFESLFTSKQAGRLDSVMFTEELKKAKLSRPLVGSKRNEFINNNNEKH